MCNLIYILLQTTRSRKLPPLSHQKSVSKTTVTGPSTICRWDEYSTGGQKANGDVSRISRIPPPPPFFRVVKRKGRSRLIRRDEARFRGDEIFPPRFARRCAHDEKYDGEFFPDPPGRANGMPVYC